MNWTIQKPCRDGWYWIRNVASEGWDTVVEPRVVAVYGFEKGEPTVAFPSDEQCTDLREIDAEWAGPVEPPA